MLQLTPQALIALFEEFDSDNGLYYFLGSFVNFSEEPDVVFKYVQAAAKLGQIKEVERICRDHEHYDANQLKEWLIEQELPDPRPLIHVCDRHGFTAELTRFLYAKVRRSKVVNMFVAEDRCCRICFRLSMRTSPR